MDWVLISLIFCWPQPRNLVPGVGNGADIIKIQVPLMSTATQQWRAILYLYRYMREWHDDKVIIIIGSPVSCTQYSFSSYVPLASLFDCFVFNYKLRRSRKTSCLLTRYLHTMKREGRPVTEAVSHFVYWHDGRSWAVPAGDFDRRPVWPCILQRNCKWLHGIEKNNEQSGPCLHQFRGK